MNPKFFLHKVREVMSFLQIMKGKVTGNAQETIRGIDNALKVMKDEKEVYLEERRKAVKSGEKDKVERESGELDRDISAL